VTKFSQNPARLQGRLLLATCSWLLAAVPVAGAAPNFASVDQLGGYQPIQDVPGAPGAHPLRIAGSGHGALTMAQMAPAQTYSDQHGGRALLVWKNGALVYETYGGGDSKSTRFETFSMHKSILGLAYGAAIADGVIGSLDDPAGKYLSAWQNDPRGKITIRELLTMESGLRFYSFNDPVNMELATGNEVTKAVLAAPQDKPPGTEFQYNNVSAQIAGTILDRALKKAGRGDYASFVSSVLLKPLGAGDAHLWLEHPGGEPRYFGEFQMGARDWLRVGIMIDQHGRFAGKQVLPADWIGQVFSPSKLNPNYGLLTWIGSPWQRYFSYGPAIPVRMSHEKPYLAKDLVFFDGFGGERVYVMPSLDLVVVRIGNPVMDFDDSVIPNDVVEAVGGGKL
jgi:CubicO group peptidase (beta-lactamase class C family)